MLRSILLASALLVLLANNVVRADEAVKLYKLSGLGGEPIHVATFHGFGENNEVCQSVAAFMNEREKLGLHPVKGHFLCSRK